MKRCKNKKLTEKNRKNKMGYLNPIISIMLIITLYISDPNTD